MQLESLDFFFQHFAQEQMHFLYTGNFNDEHTDGFIELNNHQYNAADEFKKSQRKAGFLIAECFQNIVRHTETSHKESFFHIKNNRGLFTIVSANSVKNKIIPLLKGQLEQLNKLTSLELKEAYRRRLSEGELSEKGGAGLGLIEMARRSKNKLNFSFKKIDEHYSSFYFRLHLNIAESTSDLNSNNFNRNAILRDRMFAENLFFIYKGVISIQTTIVILGIIENSIKTVNQKVVFVKFMGLFEKIAGLKLSNGEEENANMLFIGENEEEYNIVASCYLNFNEATRIDRTMKLYSFYDDKTLNDEYKRVLKEGNQSNGNDYNLDIIEILKNCLNFEFDFHAHEKDTALVSLSLKFEKKKKNIYLSRIESKAIIPSDSLKKKEANPLSSSI